ncbi:MAG: nickel-dependent hydrogenase large subunit [Thermoplasmata archaeon]|nr:nickel-dependent hydrogenase large subunit [Thermoplasmata archaeon]
MAEKTFTVPIGPIHPALKEIESFILTVDGERVVNVELDLGYSHRGLEYIVTHRCNPIQAIYIAERICGICSTSHPYAYVQSMEHAAGITPPERAEIIRAIIGELERIHSHILWAGVAAHEIGFDTLLHWTWKIRENVLDVLEAITGNRINYAMFTIGGVRRDIDEKGIRQIRSSLQFYREVFDTFVATFIEDTTVKMRTRDVGILTREEAEKQVAVGPTARGSGVPKDVRYDKPYSAYADLDIYPIVPDEFTHEETKGDVYDRIVVRIFEVLQSVHILEDLCDLLESTPGPITYQQNLVVVLNQLKRAVGEGIGRHEAPRGEVFHYSMLNKREQPVVWKVRAPTYNNYASWIPMMKGTQIADIPIVIASIDPCLSCADRMTVVDERTGKSRVMTLQEMREMGWRKTKEIKRRVA